MEDVVSVAELEKHKTLLIDEANTLVQLAVGEGRELTEDESRHFDELEEGAKGIDGRVALLKRAEALRATRALPVDAKADAPRRAYGQTYVGRPRRQKGCFFARMAHCLYVAQNNRLAAAQYAEETLKDGELAVILRAPVPAASTAVPEWAGSLVEDETRDFIELLRPMSVMARFPATRIEFGRAGVIKIPRMTQGIAGSYIGELQPIKVAKALFDSLAMTPKKIAVITVASNEILSHSTPSLEALLRDDMLRSTATVVDQQFVGGVGSAIAPAGLSTYDASPTPGTAGGGIAAAVADLQAITSDALASNLPLSNLVWLLNPITLNKLMYMRDTTGVFPFRDELAQGTLSGYRVLTSTIIPATTLLLVDASTVIIAEDLAPTLDLSTDATVQLDDDPDPTLTDAVANPTGGKVASLWQTDATGIRLLWRHDWIVRYPVAVQVVTNITW